MVLICPVLHSKFTSVTVTGNCLQYPSEPPMILIIHYIIINFIPIFPREYYAMKPMMSYLMPLPLEYMYMLGKVTRLMNINANVRILRVSKYAPMPNPIFKMMPLIIK